MHKRIFIILLLLIPIAMGLQIDAGVEIQPNSTGTPGSAGYYVVNNTVYMDELLVSENATFVNLDGANRTISILDDEGEVSENLCAFNQNCTVSPIDTVKNIYFTATSIAIQYTYKYGGIINRNIYSGFKIGGILPFALVASAIIIILLTFVVIS